MNFKAFSFQIGLRLVIMFLLMIGLALSLVYGGPILVSIILAGTIVGYAWGIFKYVNRTNQELVNLMTSLKFDDYMQSFTLKHLGQTFEELEASLNLTMRKFKELRSEKEMQAAYFRALVEHMPLPLFFIFADGRVEILNNAARKAFDVADLTHTRELDRYGSAFARDVKQIDPGESLLTTITLGDFNQQYIMSATQMVMTGKSQKLISLQNVQSQLDATELATWQNLLRVTSHEILNSLSPVSSLAKTTHGLVHDFVDHHKLDKGQKEDLQDISDGLETLVRRSEGLASFVQSYRQLTRMPPPKPVKINLARYFERLKSLLAKEWENKNITVKFNVEPKNLTLKADETMLDQALINLLKNAADALEGTKKPVVQVRAYFNRRNQVVIEVEDNGTGVDEEKADQIFVPFFTTKTRGSGVGLPLVRYILLSHGGAATYHRAESGGAMFRLAF